MLDAHRTYTAAMTRHDQMVMEAISGNVNELRILNDIERNTNLRAAIGDGIENMAHASTLIRSLASTWNVTPWIVRLLKEIEQTRAA